MRPLPSDIDAEVVVAFDLLLDGHSKIKPVSIMWVIDEVRQNLGSPMSTDALELLAVEMATARNCRSCWIGSSSVVVVGPPGDEAAHRSIGKALTSAAAGAAGRCVRTSVPLLVAGAPAV